MKHLYLALLLLPFTCYSQQNLVPNPSFEDTVSCPYSWSATGSLANWHNFNTSTSADYFNSCSNNAGIPFNFIGYQAPRGGNAYAGFVTINTFSTSFRESICARLVSPMVIGQLYEVSMYINTANSANSGSDNLDVLFFKNRDTTITTGSGSSIVPQVRFTSFGTVIDTQNWVKITDTFQADSAYTYMAVGGFYYNASTTQFQTSGSGYAYYLIDSVKVVAMTGFSVTSADTILCAKDTFTVQYDHYQTFATNNVFTVQLSNPSGSFNNPIVIGSKSSRTSGSILCTLPDTLSNSSNYRIRILSSNPADTSHNVRLYIGNPDSAAINTSVTQPVCEGKTINFSANTNVSGTIYQWNGPNSFSSTSANTLIAGANTVHNGDYIITLEFHGCIHTDTLPVIVSPLPNKPVAANNSPFCDGNMLNLTANSTTNGVDYSWTGPNSFSTTTQNPTINNAVPANSGIYIATATLNGCSRMDTTTVTVKPNPDTVTLSNNGPLCAGSTLLLNSDTSSTGASYTWSGPNSFSANTRNTTRTNTTAGMTGWYIMTVDLNGCVYKDSTYATIHPIPAGPTISHGNPLCVGETLNLAANTVSGATYTWSGPNNFSSNQQNPNRSNMQFGDTGTYKATVTINGCTSPADSVAVQLNPKPFVVILSTPMDSICNGDPVAFTAYPNNHGGTPTYSWYINNQLITTGKPFSTTALNDGDIIRCEMTENTKCSTAYTDSSNDIKMTVLPWLAPTVSITANPTTPLKENEYVTFTATPVNAGLNPDYQWKRNGNDILGATSNVWSANTLNDNDSVSVEVFSKYKCPSPTSAHSNGIRVKVLTDVDDLSAAGSMRLYPNPNNGKFVVTARCKTGDTIKLSIINAAGQVVYREDILPDSNKLHHEIDVQQLATGVYLLRMATDSGDSVLRFVVEL